MKTLFLFMLFNISDGHLTLVKQDHQLFASYEECEYFSKQMLEQIQWKKKGYQSFSTCIPQEAFYE